MLAVGSWTSRLPAGAETGLATPTAVPATKAPRPEAMSRMICSPRIAAWANASLRLPWDCSTKSSRLPTMSAFKWPAISSISASPSARLPSWRTMNSIGRKAMRAAVMLAGEATRPIRLSPKLAQSKGSGTLLRASATTSPSASTKAMILPAMGTLPATPLMRSRVAKLALTSRSQASKTTAPRPTSSIWISRSGVMATCEAREWSSQA